VQRDTDKHAPRLDEHMVQETESLERGAPVESRVEESREQEPAGEDQPSPDSRLAGGRATAASLDADEAEARSQLAASLSPSVFPADREALLASAGDNNAPDTVMGQLGRLPAGEVFENVQAVWWALGGATDRRF
jgi:hypothetical protein